MCLTSHREKELLYLANLTEAAGYIIPDVYRGHDFQEMAKDVQSQCPSLRNVIVKGDPQQGHYNMNGFLNSEVTQDHQWPQNNPMEVAVLQLSGGTTGVPKVIPCTHNDYIYNNQAIIQRVEFTAKDILMVPLPFAHNATLNHMIHPALLTGATAVVCPHEPEAISRTIEKERVTHFFTVPTIFYRWVESPDFDRYDYSSLRLTATGAQKMPPSLAYKIGTKLPGVFMQVFGMTEGVVLFPQLTDSDKVRYETVGKPISPWDEIKVVDEGGKEVPHGELGELICRGPYTIAGYFKAEEDNRKVINSDGFFWTGDLVRLDQDGNVIVEGRRKDVINRGGEKISAEEIEDLLIDHPKISRVAIIPMSDPELGEKSCAYIISEEGAEVHLQDLTDHLTNKKVAKYKSRSDSKYWNLSRTPRWVKCPRKRSRKI
jgi:2,3-dihydroxybenzoate-AMP ligase